MANRFCFFNEQGKLLGAAAQMSFKERAAAMAYSIATEELNYYKRAYEESSEEDSGFSKILGNSEAMQKLKEKVSQSLSMCALYRRQDRILRKWLKEGSFVRTFIIG